MSERILGISYHSDTFYTPPPPSLKAKENVKTYSFRLFFYYFFCRPGSYAWNGAYENQNTQFHFIFLSQNMMTV